MTISTIELAKELGKEYFRGKAIINLSRITAEFGMYDKAIEIIDSTKDIVIEDDLELQEKLNLFRLFNRCEVQLMMSDYTAALNSINEIDNYKNHFSIEDKQDIDIMQNVIRASVYIEQNKLDMAESNLSKAKEIMEVDKEVYFFDKDIYYMLVKAELNVKQGKYNEAINLCNEVINYSIERTNQNTIEIGIKMLLSIYISLGDKEKIEIYDKQLNEILIEKERKVNEDYYNYLIGKREHKLIQENNIKIKNRNFILIILIIIAVIIVFRITIYPTLNGYNIRKKVKKHIYMNEYKTYYQPIVNPKEDIVVGFEALLRLKIKDKIILPYILIKDIEVSDMMGEVTIWILKNIIKDYYKIMNMGNFPNKYYISMNASYKEIEDKEIVSTMIQILKNSGLNKGSICIEITENIGFKNLDVVRENISKLKEAGFSIAIDDFGVEHSNLSSLKRIEFDIIKLDKDFIDDINDSELNKLTIEICDYISNHMNKVLVMEGVEDRAQMQVIKETTSDKFYIQGYFYSKPVEINELKKFELPIV